jgi:S1-C subfamily serine protease
MQPATGAIPTSRSALWRNRWQRLRAGLKRLVPFAAGVCATLLALLLYHALVPPPPPLTLKQVNTAVAQAIASVTPAPAYSAQVYRAIQPSLVLIQAETLDANNRVQDALGSGVIVSDQGAILTALHVVENATDIQVTFADGTQASAQIAATQPANDIAVLQAGQLPAQLVPAVLGNPNAVQVGDEAFAFGNPFGLYGSLSAGVISGLDRSFQATRGGQPVAGLIQFDAAVNPGNSGGPLLNRNGQVIGIVIGILNPTEGEFFVGIGFAVPITTAGGAAGLPQY